MKKPQSMTARVTSGPLAALSILALTTSSASAGYTGIVLYPLVGPSTAATSVVAVSGYPQTAFDGQTVGSIAGHATLWSTPLGGPLSLNPVGSTTSDALGTDGSRQVGWAGSASVSTTGISNFNIHAVEWSGTAASAITLPAPGFSSSMAYGLDANQEVGIGSYNITAVGAPFGPTHALLWPGASVTAISAAVDLNPAGYSSSVAFATNTVHQVGYGSTANGSSHALLWSGTAASAVDLNPAGFTSSIANAVAGNEVVGDAVHNGLSNAILWNATTDAAIDLNPLTTTAAIGQSYASGTNGTLQVGWTALGNTDDATAWSGTANSAVNLNTLLPHRGDWTDSKAYTVDSQNHIFGIATGTYNGITGTYAVEWLNPSTTAIITGSSTDDLTGDGSASGTISSVPEPTAIAMIGIVAAIGLARRGRATQSSQ